MLAALKSLWTTKTATAVKTEPPTPTLSFSTTVTALPTIREEENLSVAAGTEVSVKSSSDSDQSAVYVKYITGLSKRSIRADMYALEGSGAIAKLELYLNEAAASGHEPYYHAVLNYHDEMISLLAKYTHYPKPNAKQLVDYFQYLNGYEAGESDKTFLSRKATRAVLESHFGTYHQCAFVLKTAAHQSAASHAATPPANE
jgi:hypothetical protein